MSSPNPDPTPGRRASDPATTRIEISGRTFVKAAVAVIFTLIVAWLVRQLATVLLMVLLSLVLAAVLSAIAAPLRRRGFGRGLAALAALFVVLLVGAGLLGLVLPPLITQTSELIDHVPELTDRLQRSLAGHPAIFNAIRSQTASIQRDPSELVTGILQFGVSVLGLIVAAVLILTLALYFLLDGHRVKRALLRLTSEAYRERVSRTITEAGGVVRAYFIGQAFVSTIFAVFTFVVLSILGVPYAAVLAALAFFLDAIPNIGATLATILPALVALPDSLTKALIVVGAIQVYQQLENNFISPRILSGRLNIPPIATLLMVLVGGKLLGVVGVFIAIPIAGLLPVIERIWIRGEQPGTSTPGAGTAEPPPEPPVEAPREGDEQAAA